MSKTYIHAVSSAKKFGGEPAEYMKFHEWFDQTKSHFADQRHRAILHSSFGIYLLQQVFGEIFTNSVGKVVSVRDIGEQHVLEDFKGKFIPSIQDYLVNMTLEPWMNNGNGVPESHKSITKKRPSIEMPGDTLEKTNPSPLPEIFLDGSNIRYPEPEVFRLPDHLKD